MGVFEKVMDVMKLNDEEEYYDEEFDEYEEEIPVKKTSLFRKTGTDDIEEMPASGGFRSSARGAGSSSKITSIRNTKHAAGMEVCVIKPQSFEDSREIAETLLARHTVILNMEGLDLALAQRLIDFISGSCFAIKGNLQRVSSYIFVITPEAVDISGDLSEIADAIGIGGLQTNF